MVSSNYETNLFVKKFSPWKPECQLYHTSADFAQRIDHAYKTDLYEPFVLTIAGGYFFFSIVSSVILLIWSLYKSDSNLSKQRVAVFACYCLTITGLVSLTVLLGQIKSALRQSNLDLFDYIVDNRCTEGVLLEAIGKYSWHHELQRHLIIAVYTIT